MRDYLKKFIVGLLVLALTVTSVNYNPTKVLADENATLYLEYSDTGAPYLLFASEIDGKTSDFSLWSRYAYALDDASAVVGDNWYSFEVDKDVLLSGFQVVYSTDGTESTASWVADVGLGGGADALTLLTNTIGEGYTVYTDSKVTACGTTLDEYEEALNGKEEEYYIAGAMFPATNQSYKMTEEDGLWVYELGLVSADTSGWVSVYTDAAWSKFKEFGTQSITAGYVKFFVDVTEQTLTIKSYTDDTYTTEVSDEVVEDTVYYVLVDEEYVALEDLTYKFGEVATDDIISFAVYTYADELYSVFAGVAFTAEKDGYLLFTIDEDNESLTYDYYTDDAYTTKVGDDVVSDGFTMYVNYTENSDLYLLSASAIGDLENAGTLWGKTAYKLEDASEEVGEEGWFKFVAPSKDELPVFQFVFELSDDGWVGNFGIDSGSDYYAAIKAVTGDVVYFNAKGTIYIEETLEAYKDDLDIPVEAKYYIGGKPTYFNGEVALAGNDWNVLEMTAETDGTFTYKLGLLDADTAVENTIYSDLNWTTAYSWNTVNIAATGYVKLIYNPDEGTLVQKVYSDSSYSTEVTVEDTVAKVHVYYPGTDTLTIAFWASTIKSSANYDKLGTPYGETYWTRTCYPMTKESENWYTFDVYKSFGGFQIVANPQSEEYPADNSDKENTVWLINVGDAGEGYQNDGDQERYEKLFSTGEQYIMYNTLFNSQKDAEDYDAAYAWDYYISGSTSEFEDACDGGIFSNYWSQDNYGWVEEEGRYKGTENWQDQMTKNGTTLTWISSKKAEKFKSYTMNVYADKSWFGKAGKDFAFLAVADAYVKITYDLKTKVYTVSYYDDAEGTTETEFDEVTIYYYYGSDDATNLTLVLNATVPGLKVVGTYWGRNAYAMTSIGSGWYQFKGYKALYGGFQIVDNPQGEDYSAGDTADKDGTYWYLDIGDYGDVSTADSDLSKFFDLLAAGNKAYIKYNKIFKTQSAADSFTDWTFYVAGSTTAFTNSDASKGIFSNYWAGNFEEGVDPDTGEAYTKKVDTWPDVFTKVDDSTYYVNLPNKAIKGTKYEFNVYTEKDWSATNLTGTMGAANPRIEASSNNYIRLYFYRDLKTGSTSWAVKYFADKDFKNAVKLATPTNLKLKKLKATKGAKLKLSWKAVTGASKYTIYANGKKVGTSTTNSKVLKYKKQGKTIKYTVKASGSGYAASEASKELKVKTPKKVSKVKAKNKKNGIYLKWKKVKAANGYVVYRSTKKKKGFKKVATLKKNTKVKFLDKKAKKGKTYYYRVYAYKKNGKVLVYSAPSKNASAKKK